MQDTNWKGALAETGVIHAATELGLTVLKPLSDGRRYDLVFDTGAQLLRAQCKWAPGREMSWWCGFAHAD